jgi:hypothetical protein
MKKYDFKAIVVNIFHAAKNRIGPWTKYGLINVDINPIIVYQMGKVGSKTIEASLLHYFSQRKWRVAVYHTHNLINLDKMSARIRSNEYRPAPQATLSQIRKDQKLRKIIDENPVQRWSLVSLVRDPIAQNVGAFFHNLKEFIPDWKERYESQNLSMQDLQEFYIKKYHHHATRQWFETQMEPMWGIDVYSKPFDIKRGFTIYKSEKADLLLVKLENLNTSAALAFYEFLKFENFEIINQNIGEEKNYKDLYKEFKSLPLASDFVEYMYNTRFMRHFYTEDETRELKEKWTRGGKR